MNSVIIATIISFLIVLTFGPFFIPLLKKLKFGQTIREEGPKSHMSKAGTPTMGGIIIILAITLTSLIYVKDKSDILIALLSMLGFGFIGFIDDFIMIILRRNLGLKAYQKLILQFALAVLLSVYAANHQLIGTYMAVPFTTMFLDFKFLYIPFTFVFIVGFVNAVNLTDGLDGLASGVSVFASIFFVLASLHNGYNQLAVFASCLVGACLGFLRYNKYPAQVFMGDTGSMALGGGLVALAVLTRMQLFFFIVGGVFLIEALSVMIQVSFFKLTGGKRVFKMAPIHHHYELKGWHEKRIVKSFWFVSFVLTLVGYLGIIIR